MLKQSVQILKNMQYPTGLFAASRMTVKTGYNLAWIRDNVYTAIGLEAANKKNDVKRLLRALLDILLKHEFKINHAISKKPDHVHQYIHARYDPITKEEIWEEWGNKQHDAIGSLLFKVADLEKKGIKIIRNNNDLRILQKLVDYLESIEYWHNPDHGVWEEAQEIHASSIGACVAGLKNIKGIVTVKPSLIKKGQNALNKLLPRESKTKKTDLALLSLIYPYKVTTKKQTQQILKNIETRLVREKGVIRYIGDQYYYRNGEAEWTKGFPWLALIYKQLGNKKKQQFYLNKSKELVNEHGELPELYYSRSHEYNENCPLAWSQAMLIASLS